MHLSMITAPEDKIEQADAIRFFLKALITQTLVYDNEIEGLSSGIFKSGEQFCDLRY